MGKLEQLRATVAQLFDQAENAEQLKQLAEVNKQIDEVEQEQTQLTHKYSETLEALKEAWKHTSFKEKPKEVETQPTSREAPDLEVELANFLATQNKEEK